MQKYPRYAQLNNVEIVNAETSASLISNDALFISYLIGTGVHQNHVLVFTLDNTGKLQAYDLSKHVFKAKNAGSFLQTEHWH
jgi:hypothetical protein